MMRYEITVLASPDDRTPMTLMDRCVLTAKNTQDAARKYAELFTGPARETTPEENE